MEKWSSKVIRQKWIDFWVSKNHKLIASKSLIPHNDKSILWINSGVATLKDFFAGVKTPHHPRLVNSQKALRTNDIENVGVTARHHTFFEMLGNFSLGNYFKDEVISWAYELLFDVFKFDLQKIYITYFQDDQETYDKWLSLGIKKSHLIKGNKATNFWDLGSGPCGPDTEIFYDRGIKFDPDQIGLKLLKDDLENDRYVEIWNIVFSEFNNDGQNNYLPLKQKNIDTGAGLERIVAIFQDGPTNFDTDLFLPIIQQIETMTTAKYDINNYFTKNHQQGIVNKHFRIIADHMRAICFAIQDGAKPSNVQRGYIIRRLIRRAYRSGLMLQIKEQTFLHKLVAIVKKNLDVFPMDQDYVAKIIKQEEQNFAATITQGQELLNKHLQHTKNQTIDPKIVFKMYETYGFPIELTIEILQEHNINVDVQKINEYKLAHAKISQNQTATGMQQQIQVIQNVKSQLSTFIGYEHLSTVTKVLFCQKEAENYYVLLEKTPFYATGGGQHHDLGKIDQHEVINVFKDKYENIWHVLKKPVQGQVQVQVDTKNRKQQAQNHSATHLLNYALRQVFGPQVVQLGSDNNAKRLRFDFPLEKKATTKQLQEVEKIVNHLIKQNLQREYLITTFAQGQKMGALALANEEYPPVVRIVKFGSVVEFCGGTHIENTKSIEQFKIIKFLAKGSGIFRIEAVTSFANIKQLEEDQIATLSKKIKTLFQKNKSLDQNYHLTYDHSIVSLEHNIKQAQQDYKKLIKQKQVTLPETITFKDFEGKKSYINLNQSANEVKRIAINLREAYPDSLFIIGAQQEKNTILAISSKTFNAKNIFDQLAQKFDGKGGGNATFAMGSMSKKIKL